MIESILNQYKEATSFEIILEVLVFVFGILSVVFAKKENILVYPTGLIATVITVYLLYQAKYFGDMTLNIYYSVMSVYGWYNWAKGDNDHELEITRTNFTEKLIGFLIFLVTMFITYLVYVAFDHPLEKENYVDIFTSGIFFTAMWYMAIKKIENWTLWIIGDLIAVPLFWYRDLNMLALQYLIFTILAILAYIEWKKILNKQKPE